MGVEIKESPVTEEAFAEMEQFVYDYLRASVENEDGGGRMRWYPWHSADYRFNHIVNVAELADEIARKEGADRDVVNVATLFHDIAKLDADQDAHADEGARVAREYLETHGTFPASFIDRVCKSIAGHSTQRDLSEVPLETRCLIEADIIDKIGANGAILMLLRMGYEARTHMNAAEMVDRVRDRGEGVEERIVSDTAETIAHKRLTRVNWLCEWLEDEVPNMTRAGVDDPAESTTRKERPPE